MQTKKVNLRSQLPWSIFILLFFILFIGIRLIHLPESLNFGSDQGRDFLSTWSIFTHKRIAFIGPPSQYAIDGRQFFFGPAPYYIILPALLASKWSPLFVSYYLIFYNAVILAAAFFIFKKCIKNTLIIYLFATLTIFSPAIVTYTRSYWNPYFMFSTATLLVSLLVYCRENTSNTRFVFIAIGFLFGLGLQFHYSFILAITLSMIVLLWSKKISLSTFLNILIGFVVGFLPLIAYDMTHNFYNLRTFFLLFTSHSGTHVHFNLTTSYYFISVLPFFYLTIVFLLAKSKLLANYLTYIFFALYIILSIIMVAQKPLPLLSYQRLQIIAKSVEAHNPSDFNIVDQLTSDNRALALRYLLTVDGYIPHTVEDYQSPKELFVYSKEPITLLLKNPVYEIKSFLPFKTMKIQNIDHDLYLYILKK